LKKKELVPVVLEQELVLQVASQQVNSQISVVLIPTWTLNLLWL
jgi:hypothetical protein